MQLDKHALAMEMLATAEGMLGVSDQYERSRINNMRATCLYKVGDYHGAITLLEIAVSIALDQGGLTTVFVFATRHFIRIVRQLSISRRRRQSVGPSVMRRAWHSGGVCAAI